MPGTMVRALVAWSGLLAVAVLWGAAVAVDTGVALNAAPFVGRLDPSISAPFLLPLGVGALVVAVGPSVAASVRFSAMAAWSAVAAVGWTVALAVTDGWDRLTAPLTTRHEYEPFAATLQSPRGLLRGFDATDATLPIHVRGHPPGALLPPWVLDRLGLDGAGWFAGLILVGWGVAVAAALVAARTVAGEAAARRAAPALVLLPGAVWAGTSADALFAGVFAVGVALAVHPSLRSAFAGGLVFGSGLLLTYGGALMVAMPSVLQLRRRRWQPALVTGIGILVVLAAVWAWSGFWWLDGLRSTREAYWDGVAARRPALYLTAVGNPGAFAAAMGPAVLAGLWGAGRRWRQAASWLPLLGLGAVLIANLSQMSRGEVERIWLLFLPWVALAAPGERRGWLAVQVLAAVAVQAVLRSPW